jgi:hypothetical protein
MRGSRWLYYRQRKAANACYIRRHSSHNFHHEARVERLPTMSDALDECVSIHLIAVHLIANRRNASNNPRVVSDNLFYVRPF